MSRRVGRDRRFMGGSSPTLAPLAPAVWLEPSALDTLSSGRLAQAYDISGNGRHAVQGTAANQPLLVAGAGPGGRDCWRFSNARPDFLSIAHDAGISGVDWTVFALVKTAAAQASIVSKTVGAAARAFDAIIFGNVMNLGGEVNGVTAVNTNTWRAIGARRGVALAEASAWVDKAKDATAALQPFTDGAGPIRIGLRDDAFGALTGDIAHVCAWNRALSDAEIAQVGVYFARKFGV